RLADASERNPLFGFNLENDFWGWFLDGICQSSLAAARADNFYYPPEWTPKQGSLNKFHGQHALRERARKIDQGILIIRFEMPYNIWCGGCNSMIAKERGKLADPFYRLEHQEKDMQKKKEAEPVLVRLQRLSDSRHADDYTQNRTLRAQLRNQKKRVAEEENVSRKMGLGIRLLPATEEDSAVATRMKFSSKFEKNRRDKRALIHASSIFHGSSRSSIPDKKRLDLESKRRKICASAASTILTGSFKPSSWSQSAANSTRRDGASVTAKRP
ncbi:Coiled-coil domain-containing protein, partial [Cucurbita argyrosperma subsp. argyrosperma]